MTKPENLLSAEALELIEKYREHLAPVDNGVETHEELAAEFAADPVAAFYMSKTRLVAAAAVTGQASLLVSLKQAGVIS